VTRIGILSLAGVVAVLAFMPSSAAAAQQCQPPYCPSYRLKVEKSGSGSGTVTSSPAGIDCGSHNCSAEYEQGTRITLTATAASGSTFAGWSAGGCSGTGTCTVTLNSNTTVVAHFDVNAPPAPPPPPNNFSLKKVKHPQTGVVTIGIKVPGPGAMEAQGRKMNTVKALAKAGGSYSLRLQLTEEGMKLLRKSQGRQLRVKVHFTYTPDGGTARTKIKKIIFRVVGSSGRHSKRHKRHSKRASASLTLLAAENEGKVVVASTATVTSKQAKIRVFCNGPQSCHGRLRLIGVFAPQDGKPKVSAALGSVGFNLSAGVSKVLAARLTSQARHLFENRRAQKARVAGSGLHPHGVKLRFAK
jgi:Divergent InlB B-repeat domain